MKAHKNILLAPVTKVLFLKQFQKNSRKVNISKLHSIQGRLMKTTFKSTFSIIYTGKISAAFVQKGYVSKISWSSLKKSVTRYT